MVLDINMPRVDGRELLLLMESENITVPTIVMTGETGFEKSTLERFANVVGFFPKPFDMSVMREAVTDCVEPKVEVMVLTRAYKIVGQLTILGGRTISEHFAQSGPCIEVTDAEVSDPDGRTVFKAASLHVCRGQIEMVVRSDALTGDFMKPSEEQEIGRD